MSFISGLIHELYVVIILGGILGGSFALVIATLMISSGRASEDERVREAYRAGVKLGRGSRRSKP